MGNTYVSVERGRVNNAIKHSMEQYHQRGASGRLKKGGAERVPPEGETIVSLINRKVRDKVERVHQSSSQKSERELGLLSSPMSNC
jgi:hypothetical protein